MVGVSCQRGHFLRVGHEQMDSCDIFLLLMKHIFLRSGGHFSTTINYLWVVFSTGVIIRLYTGGLRTHLSVCQNKYDKTFNTESRTSTP